MKDLHTASKYRVRSAVGVAIGCFGLAPSALADWGVTPSLNLVATRQSNPQLSFSPTPTGSGALVRVGLPLDWHGDLYSFTFKPVLTTGFQQGNVVAGIRDQRVDVEFVRATERSNVQLSGSATRSQLYGQTAADVATFSSYGTVEGRRADFSVTYAVSERVTGAVGATWRSTRYKPTAAGQLDFDYPSARAQWSMAVTEKLKMQVGVSAARLQVPGLNLRNTERSATLSAVWVPVEGMEIQVGGGPTKTIRSSDGSSATKNSYSASVNWLRPTFDFSLFAKRGVVPTSGGVLTFQSDYGLRGGYRATERLSLNYGLGRSRFSQQLVGIDLGGRSYHRLDLGLDYKLTEQWTLTAGYGRGRLVQTFDFLGRQPGTAVSAQYSLGLARTFGRHSF